ncbi:DUF4169 family protein [Nannocystis sp. SCPEA4]|jgi:hypothetical protein|uniref:DUF4169 family protein n=1 Tax=Nannocystis sp. SCPEA4 TaxID=2996787 RepID=UPI002271C3F0|nr:DUF4169 family protein [Nannocystis sp. SCPEA4]MCY1054321.1 DUF4169 family protein [Nannocystis sp. SCPEA4]
MGDVINLNRYRKAKARAEKEQKAEANRARHARTRAEKQTVQRELDRQSAELDGKRLDSAEDGPQGP